MAPCPRGPPVVAFRTVSYWAPQKCKSSSFHVGPLGLWHLPHRLPVSGCFTWICSKQPCRILHRDAHPHIPQGSCLRSPHFRARVNVTCSDLGCLEMRGPQYRPQYTLSLWGPPKNVPLIFGSPYMNLNPMSPSLGPYRRLMKGFGP